MKGFFGPAGITCSLSLTNILRGMLTVLGLLGRDTQEKDVFSKSTDRTIWVFPLLMMSLSVLLYHATSRSSPIDESKGLGSPAV